MSDDEIRALGTGATCCGTCGCLESTEQSAPPAPPVEPPTDEEPTP